MSLPYGLDTGFWMRRLITHDNEIALVFCRIDAECSQDAIANSSATLLVRRRIAFVLGHENSHKKAVQVLAAQSSHSAKNVRSPFSNRHDDPTHCCLNKLIYRRSAAIWSNTAAEAADAARLFHLDCALSGPYKSPLLSTFPPH